MSSSAPGAGYRLTGEDDPIEAVSITRRMDSTVTSRRRRALFSRRIGSMLGKLLFGIVFSLGTPLAVLAQERHYVSYGGTAGFQATLWAMHDLGTFEKYGLNGDVVLVGGSARQIQGVLGGSTDFAQVDITAVVAANLKGAGLGLVGGTLNRIPFSMVTQPEIREPSQLRGKKIGVVNFGGANEYAVLAALNEWGIPSSAATIMPAGGAAPRLRAMSAKALDATVLSP